MSRFATYLLVAIATIVVFPAVTLAQTCIDWTDVTPPPGVRSEHAMAYDSARGVTVLFGGRFGDNAPSNETWEYNGQTWTRRYSAHSPSPKRGCNMAFDSTRGVTVLFGGYATDSINGISDETWEWNGSDWTKRNSVTKPSARYAHAMAYDSTRHVVMLQGGHASFSILADLWEWNGTNWTQRSTGGPPARYNHSMAYDSARGVSVIVAGRNASSNLSDTWEWNGTAWSQRSPANVPAARYGYAMAYDSIRHVTVMHSGYTTFRQSRLFEWDGINWTERQAPVVPTPRVYHNIVFDSARGVCVMVGGDDGGLNGETWEWNGALWTRKSQNLTPPFLYFAAIGYDAERGESVLFGGKTELFTPIFGNDTWTWNGSVWSNRGPATRPSARAYHAMTYDSTRKVVVLFGGYVDFNTRSNETWEWNGTNWTKCLPALSPSARGYHALAYDSTRGVTVLFGGSTGGPSGQADTWEWNGTNWVQRTPPTSPPARWGHAMAYDSARGKTVLFGGISLSDTWEWDGTNWTQQFPTASPGLHVYHGLVFDAQRGLTLLYGGANWSPVNFAYDRTYAWDGANWTLLSTAAPPGRYGMAMCYDNRRGRTVMYGGEFTDGLTMELHLNETWELDIHTPQVNAGGPYAACDLSPVSLAGLATNHAGVTWSSSGTGTFDDLNALATAYHPSPADLSAGVITLSLTAAGNTPCDPAQAQATLTFFSADCDTNGSADRCEPGYADCNTNSVADACELLATDCNSNGVSDTCDALGHDCNTNGTPDVCDTGFTDCNTNGLADFCEPPAADCNANGTPDRCESTYRDCNTNASLDACEPGYTDCNADGTADACQPGGRDCNTNNTIDACEPASGDCNTNAVPDACELPFTEFLNTPMLSLPISDANLGGLTYELVVRNEGLIADLNVRLNIAHTACADLSCFVIHNGVSVLLLHNNGGTGDHFAQTMFDDQASSSIMAGSAPFNNTYRPLGMLAAFNGMDKAGLWTLKVTDLTAANTGTLIRWALFITDRGNDCNTNGSIDACDPGYADCNTNGLSDFCEPPPVACPCFTCAGDLTGNLRVDGADVAAFVQCYLTGPIVTNACRCGDMNANDSLDAFDVTLFVSRLLLAPDPACP